MSYALYFDVCSHGQLVHSDACPALPSRSVQLYSSEQWSKNWWIFTYRLRLIEETIIHLIHRREIRHASQENIDLDAILQRATSFFENRGEVLQTLCLFI